MNTTLRTYLDQRKTELDQLDETRRQKLQPLIDYVLERQKVNAPSHLNFICTHNSRRSHMAQLWCAASAAYMELGEIHSFSGGTEATAFHPNALAAMQQAGFSIDAESEGENPHYLAQIDQAEMIEVFSKKFDDEANPASDFAAVMVCSEAEEACPFVPGCDERISLPYDDPKDADGTPQEQQAYEERAAQIAREMLYVMTEVNRHV